jgi:hypothetical protein
MARILVAGGVQRLLAQGRGADRRGLAREATDAPGTVACVDLGLIPKDHPFGRVSPVSGAMSGRASAFMMISGPMPEASPMVIATVGRLMSET